MKSSIQFSCEPSSKNAAIFVTCVDEKGLQKATKELTIHFEQTKRRKTFSGKFGEVSWCKNTLLLGIGKKQDLTAEKVRRLIGKVTKTIRAKKYESFATDLTSSLTHVDQQTLGRALAEGAHLANYSFDKYKQKDKQETRIKKIIFLQKKSSALEQGLKQGTIIAGAANMARDLVNEPANIATPAFLEKTAREIAKIKGVSLKILTKQDMRRLKMGALLGVAQGSSQEPRLLILEYKGAKQKPTAIVGKGITFDSGGYNIKPTGYMENMKTDMGGAAAVLASLKAAAQLNLKKHLIGVVPTCENMVSANAQRPGDIVRAFNGLTIEITNTDAEGRLILADALSYTCKTYKPKTIIDLATLTGAVGVALGHFAAGLMSSDDNLKENLKVAGETSGDRVWELPFFDDYQDAMNGTISDLQNTSNTPRQYGAGTITAGVFLSKFVTKETKWAHLDIASSARWSINGDYLSKGPTGSGARVITYYLMRD